MVNQRKSEIRSAPLVIREPGGDSPGVIEGHAVVWNAMSELLFESFYERFLPGAFKKWLASTPDIRALYNHKTDAVLGRTKSGTLTLSEDETGLRFRIDLPDTTLGRDVRELVRRGDISQMSFDFKPMEERTGIHQGRDLFEIVAASLYEVSPVTWAAYQQTSVNLRTSRCVAGRGLNLAELDLQLALLRG